MVRLTALVLTAATLARPAMAQDENLFKPQSTVGLYSKSYALIIGNSDYDVQDDLPKVKQDVQVVGDALVAQGFEVEPIVTDANGAGLRDTIAKFVDKVGYEKDARVLIWIAGHGVTVNGEGYLLGTDAPAIKGDSDDSILRDFYGASMPLRSFGTILREMRSLHVMLVLDSCFAATIFSSTRSSVTRARELEMRNPTRQIITSGGPGQPVADDGKFARFFADAISGKATSKGKNADSNGDGYLSGTELGFYLAQQAETSLQKPQYGKLPSANTRLPDYAKGIDVGRSNFEEGEFFFMMPEAPEIEVAVAATQPVVTAVRWRDLAEGTRIVAGDDPVFVYAQTPPNVGERKFTIRSGESYPAAKVGVRFQSATIGDQKWLRFEQEKRLYYVLEQDVTIKRPN